jgi:hypothetical protein
VNQSEKQHQLAVNLLKELGVDYVRLERQPVGGYGYRAWSVPLIVNNGFAGKAKRGKVRLMVRTVSVAHNARLVSAGFRRLTLSVES